ncbi:hypothetical protein [Microbacterium maritypicum]
MQTATYLSRTTKFNDTTAAKAHSTILATHLGEFSNAGLPKKVARIVAKHSYAALTPETRELVTDRSIVGVEPGSVMDAFIRDSVTVAAPHTTYAAKLLLTQAAQYVQWCVGQGWPLQADVIWSVRGIDLYSTTANRDNTEGTRRNYRSMLLRISEVLLPEEHPERPTPLTQKDVTAPYTPSEMDDFRDWAGAQLTELAQCRAILMLTLCTGAGVRPGELPFLRHEDIAIDENGILVTVAGRTVPLLAEWEEWLVNVLSRRPKGELLWGKVNIRNTSRLASTFTERSFGKPPRADRLRHTWLVGHLAAAVPMKELMRAAGIEKIQHLHMLLEFVDLRPAVEGRALLRGEVRR